eukprot:m.47691 g.47691  ORF g.47691 m.47691 type:complete len:326 (-) comp5994_c0_seq2:97-1074(-)
MLTDDVGVHDVRLQNAALDRRGKRVDGLARVLDGRDGLGREVPLEQRRGVCGRLGRGGGLGAGILEGLVEEAQDRDAVAPRVLEVDCRAPRLGNDQLEALVEPAGAGIAVQIEARLLNQTVRGRVLKGDGKQGRVQGLERRGVDGVRDKLGPRVGPGGAVHGRQQAKGRPAGLGRAQDRLDRRQDLAGGDFLVVGCHDRQRIEVRTALDNNVAGLGLVVRLEGVLGLAGDAGGLEQAVILRHVQRVRAVEHRRQRRKLVGHHVDDLLVARGLALARVRVEDFRGEVAVGPGPEVPHGRDNHACGARGLIGLRGIVKEDHLQSAAA